MQSDRDTEPNTSLRDSELSENEGLPGFSLFPDGPIFAETESGEREREGQLAVAHEPGSSENAFLRVLKCNPFFPFLSPSLRTTFVLSPSPLGLSSLHFRRFPSPFFANFAQSSVRRQRKREREELTSFPRLSLCRPIHLGSITFLLCDRCGREGKVCYGSEDALVSVMEMLLLVLESMSI